MTNTLGAFGESLVSKFRNSAKWAGRKIRKPAFIWGLGLTLAAASAIFGRVGNVFPALGTALREVRAGEWVQAGGAALGVAFTVAVTLAIERYNRNAPARETDRAFREALDGIKRAADQVRATIGRNPTPGSNEVNSLIASEHRLLRSIDGYQFVRKHNEPRNLVQWSALADLEDVITPARGRIRNEQQILIQHGELEMPVKIHCERIEAEAQSLRAALSHARPQFG